MATSDPSDGWHGWFAPTGRPWPRPADVGVAVAVAVLQVVGTILYSSEEPGRWDLDALAYALLVAGPLALLVRRRWPGTTLLVTCAAAAAYVAGGWPRGPAGLPAFVFALVSVILIGRRRLAWVTLAVAFPAFVWLPSLVPDELEAKRSLVGVATNLAWLPLVAAVAEIVRLRLDRRAEQVRAAQEEVRRRAGDERLRIARELHDVLAHNISLINVQAGVALYLLEERPERDQPTVDALGAIREASRDALGGLRSALDVLRLEPGDGGAGGAGGDRAPLAPTAGLRDLDGLVRRTRAAGLDVDLAVEGEARAVPAGVDLAAFRIVQEALTNVVRHAGDGARATVRLVYAPAGLEVRIDDNGPPPAGPVGLPADRPDGPTADRPDRPTAAGPTAAGADGWTACGSAADGPTAAGRDGPTADSPTAEGLTAAGADDWTACGSAPDGAAGGRGIAGMRERVQALGGTFAAGPRPGRGFRVRAQLPLAEGTG